MAEEGEIYDDDTGYDPALEWPDGSETAFVRLTRPLCRLVVSQTSILPSKHKVVAVDNYSEMQFGRDPATGGTPRVRLKEMQVSKLHATVYWDSARGELNVVDMGSKHGTFLRSSSGPGSSNGEGIGNRLSAPRVASLPRRLRHMDSLAIGSTTFLVHIHEDKAPCHDCTGYEIPLFSTVTKRIPDPAPTEPLVLSSRQVKSSARSSLTSLRRSLLTRHADDESTHSTGINYTDRSARRRALYTPSPSDAPGTTIASSFLPPSRSEPLPEPIELVSQPPVPVPPSNIGHRLLKMQGWEPGAALGIGDPGDGRFALVEPLTLATSIERAGLGMPTDSRNLRGRAI
ncbi:hypothetical protein C8J56DRAFT_930306 [Mycena floridula]|nr:hypothetical protein C8J56DRAFT_930306 [Mycena floridula]